MPPEVVQAPIELGELPPQLAQHAYRPPTRAPTSTATDRAAHA